MTPNRAIVRHVTVYKAEPAKDVKSEAMECGYGHFGNTANAEDCFKAHRQEGDTSFQQGWICKERCFVHQKIEQSPWSGSNILDTTFLDTKH